MSRDDYTMYRNWAEIVLKLFKRKVQDYELWNTGDLYKSLAYHVVSHSNGDVSRIEFFYNYYGKFQDLGMGRGMELGKRKKKPWYSKVFYGNMNDLAKLVAERYGQEASKKIVYSMGYKGVKILQ